MNRTVIGITLRQLLGRKRLLLMLLVALVPVAIALVYRLGDRREPPLFWAADTLYQDLIVTTLLPLIALVVGTAVLGAELDDGTAFFLLAKPLARSKIILSKLFVSVAITALLTVTATAAAGVVALDQLDNQGIVSGFVVGVLAGSLLYCCAFMLLSVLSSRALILGLIYVFVWEGLVSGLFSGTRVLSIRQYTLGIADAITSVRVFVFEAQLNAVTAIGFAAGAVVLTTWLAIRRLESFEIGEKA